MPGLCLVLTSTASLESECRNCSSTARKYEANRAVSPHNMAARCTVCPQAAGTYFIGTHVYRPPSGRSFTAMQLVATRHRALGHGVGSYR